MRNQILYILIIIYFSACQQRPKRELPNQQGVIAEKAMVVSAHPLASQVGVDIMQKGGNAVDAAIAVHFALAVVYPAAGNIGGGGFMVYRTDEGDFYSLDYREKAPLASSRNMYLNEFGEVDSEKSRYGYLASGVPGSVDGMVSMHERFGSLSWKELLEPSIHLAGKGLTLTEKEANALNNNRGNFEKYNMITPDFLIKEEWREGDKIYYRDLAKTLTRISIEGRAGFYDGETARLIVEEMERGGGLITYEDLSSYQSVWRDPISFGYKNFIITSMGPPSSGGVAIDQLFKMIEPFPIKDWGPDHENTIHIITEAEKYVYADRAKYLGDPDFLEIPVGKLTNKRYLLDRIANVDFEKASTADQIYAGVFPEESEETTHFSVVDPFGNAVSSTTTLNGGFGSKVVVDGAGFFLNNEMDDFSAKPGFPNMYGLIGGEANAIAPNKRMLSSMTPTIVEKKGNLFMVVGTPGGSTIITSVFQTILNVIEFDMHMQAAVNFQRFHHQWKPDYIQVEPGRFMEYTTNGLIKKGHEIKERNAIGRVDAILVLGDGKLEGGADPRGDDASIGF